MFFYEKIEERQWVLFDNFSNILLIQIKILSHEIVLCVGCVSSLEEELYTANNLIITLLKFMCFIFIFRLHETNEPKLLLLNEFVTSRRHIFYT